MMLFVPFAGWLKLSGLILAGVGACFLGVILLNYRFGGQWLEVLARPLEKLPGGVGNWLHRQLGKFMEGLRLVSSFSQFMRVAALSLLTWLCWIGVTYFCLLAMGLSLSPLAAVFLIVVLNFGLMIPSSPGGLGIFEFMVILALAAYGVDKETALGMGFIFHMLQYVLTIVLGWIFVVQLNLSMTAMVRQAESPEPTA